jgi:hypothetical protein
MDKEEIIEMAFKAGVEESNEYNHLVCTEVELVTFAKLVAAKATDEANARANASWTLMCKRMVEAEREACLNIACDYTQKFADHTYTSAVADAIRARGVA